MSQFADDLEMRPGKPFGLLVQASVAGTRLDRVPPATLLETARQHRILVLRGFEPPGDADALAAFGATLGAVLPGKYGQVLELVEQDDPADGVFGANWLPYHWDGMFFERVPEFQVFQCVRAPGTGQGGRTLFCDTTLALANAEPEVRARWAATEVTYSIGTVSHYGGTARSPMVVPHPDRGFPTLRYHEPVPPEMDFPNPISLRVQGVPAGEVEAVQRTARAALYDPRNHYAHEWHTGDIVIADNYTLLHAREAFTTRASRHLRRVHVLGDPALTNPAIN